GHVSKAGPVFDLKKLDWLNARWLRERLDDDAFTARVLAWAAKSDRHRAGLSLARSRIEKLSDLPRLTSFLFEGALPVTEDDFAGVKTKAEDTGRILAAARVLPDTLPEWTAPALQAAVTTLAEELGLKLRVAVGPLYV